MLHLVIWCSVLSYLIIYYVWILVRPGLIMLYWLIPQSAMLYCIMLCQPSLCCTMLFWLCYKVLFLKLFYAGFVLLYKELHVKLSVGRFQVQGCALPSVWAYGHGNLVEHRTPPLRMLVLACGNMDIQAQGTYWQPRDPRTVAQPFGKLVYERVRKVIGEEHVLRVRGFNVLYEFCIMPPRWRTVTSTHSLRASRGRLCRSSGSSAGGLRSWPCEAAANMGA